MSLSPARRSAPLSGRHALKRERQFLPAALEILETPPSPVGRGLLWAIIGFLALAAVWAAASEVDIVAVAHGKLVPAGKTKVVQSLAAGRIVAIHAKEGQGVSEGDLLVELDRSAAHADVSRLMVESNLASREVSRLDRLASWIKSDAPEQKDLDPAGDTLLAAEWNEYLARLDTLDARRREMESRLVTAGLRVEKLEAQLPVVEKRAANERSLTAKKMFPEQEYLKTEEQRLELVHGLKAQRGQVRELAEAVRTVEAEIVHSRTEFVRNVHERLEEARRRQAVAEQELLKAREHEAALLLHAPVDGVVDQLAVHTVGGVVTPAQELMVIVPRDTALEAEAVVQNKDVGFVEEGQSVELKLEAFPFTRYGTVTGEVLDISDDAINDESLGLVYRARVGIDREAIDVDGKPVSLSPGMAVTAEVKTGQRRLIEFVMAPVLRAIQESARER